MLIESLGRKASPKFWSEHILKDKKTEERAFQAKGTHSGGAVRHRTPGHIWEGSSSMSRGKVVCMCVGERGTQGRH